MTKIVVTHLAPDLDGITGVWLIRKYLPHWDESELRLVPAGTSLNNADPDADQDIIHVDTGGGRFDHHDTNAATCAAALVYAHLKEAGHIPSKDQEALDHIIRYVIGIDHFEEVNYPDPLSDVYDFTLHQLIHGIRASTKSTDEFYTHISVLLESAFVGMKVKLYALRDVDAGITIQSVLGKTLVMESKNEESIKVAIKKGYAVAMRKDPTLGYVKCKSHPVSGPDLTPLYEILKKRDPLATWVLHASKHIIINGSSMTPDAAVTTLTLPNLIEIIRSMK